MTTTPERVKRAIDATAEQVTADSIAPFVVPEPAPRFAGWPGQRTARRPRWLAPVAAAISMAIIAAGVLAISNVVASHPRPPQAARAVPPPPYYAALTRSGPPQPPRSDVTIRATATGKVLATVSPRAHFVFHLISAAADDRTFIAAAVKPVPHTANSSFVRFYLLRFNATSDSVSVRELPITNVTVRYDNIFMALSPDGRYLAVTTVYFAGIRVYSVRTGAERTWVLPPHNFYALGPAWAPDSHTLAFLLVGPKGGLRLLDTSSRSRNLLLASRQVRALRGPAGSNSGPDWFLPRQSTIATTTTYLTKQVLKTYFADISLRTGEVLWRVPLPGSMTALTAHISPQVAWADPTGRTVIVIIGHARPRPYGSASAYIVTSGGVTKLPGATWHGELGPELPAAW
jgi:hypothetical protein